MSKKQTEKTVHIDRVEDQDILNELESELESKGLEAEKTTSERRRSQREKESHVSGKRTARPYTEVMAAGKDPVTKESQKEKFDTKNLDEVLEFIDTDSYKNHRVRRTRPEPEPEIEEEIAEDPIVAEKPEIQEVLERELNKTKRKSKIIIPIILIAALAFFIVSYYLFMGDVSTLFLIPVIVFAVLTVLFLLMMRAKRNGRRIVGRILSIILAAIMVVGGCGLTYLNIKLGRTMGQTADATHMVVIVRMDDPAQKIEDAKTYKFGYEDRTQPKSMEETIADIETHIGAFVRTKYDSTEEECQDLLDGEIDAVIMNAMFIETMDDVIDDFSDQVRVIYTHDIAQAYLEMTPVKQGQSFNVLISGIDTYGEIESVSRSDVNQLMTVNPTTKQILLTSTPRDYYVQIPNVSGEERDKLTHAGIYGIQATADTLGNLYDTDINYYVRINFTSLIEVVDTLGGIDVNSEVAFSAGGYDFVAGENYLNGEQALAFSRERHSFEEGDNQRGKNQQYVITAILKKMMSREALSHPVELFDSLSCFVQTNMTKGEFVALAADLLASGESYSIDRQQATGEGGSDVTYSMPGRNLYVMYPDEESVEKITKRIKMFLEAD